MQRNPKEAHYARENMSILLSKCKLLQQAADEPFEIENSLVEFMVSPRFRDFKLYFQETSIKELIMI